MTDRRVVVDLTITADEYLRVYKGTARDVIAQSLDGRSVKFPANILRPFVSHDGINGRFEIVYGSDGRFRQIKRQVTSA